MDLISFIAYSLAVWRVSKAITDEEGPFSIFTRMRARWHQGTWYGRGINCLWCISFWIGILLGIAARPVLDGIVYGLSWSAMSILIEASLILMIQRQK